MMWRLVDALYLRLGDKFEEIFKNFYITLDNYWSSTPREELCVQLMTEKYFETPLSRIYVEKFFDGDSKKSVRKGIHFTMFHLFKEAMTPCVSLFNIFRAFFCDSVLP